MLLGYTNCYSERAWFGCFCGLNQKSFLKPAIYSLHILLKDYAQTIQRSIPLDSQCPNSFLYNASINCNCSFQKAVLSESLVQLILEIDYSTADLHLHKLSLIIVETVFVAALFIFIFITFYCFFYFHFKDISISFLTFLNCHF